MSTYSNGGSMAGTIVKLVLFGILAIIALKVGLAIAGFVIGLGFFALFTLGPILLVGWLVLKVLRYFSRDAESATI